MNATFINVWMIFVVLCSWRDDSWQGLTQFGAAHPRTGWHGGHEGGSVGCGGRVGAGENSSGWERTETGRAGGEDSGHDVQRRLLLQTCAWRKITATSLVYASVRHVLLLIGDPLLFLACSSSLFPHQIMLKYKDKKWYQLWGSGRPSLEDSRSIISVSFFSSCIVLSLMSSNCHSHPAQRRSCWRKERREGKERMSNTPKSPFFSGGGWVSSPQTDPEETWRWCCPLLYLHQPCCHSHCHSVCKESTKQSIVGHLGERDDYCARKLGQTAHKGLKSAGLPSKKLLIICH